MRDCLRRTLLLTGCLAYGLAGCEKDEPIVAGESQVTAAGESRTAWIDADRIINADSEPGNWLAHGRTFNEERHSPLDQINVGTVGNLELAWYIDLDTSRGQEATPNKGMPSWAQVVSGEDSEAIRAFIVFMANQ